jgi:hypothetical protein
VRPVLVTVSPPDAARRLLELLEDYFAKLAQEGDPTTISIEPIDTRRRGTVIYRVIQASWTIENEYPEARMYIITEDGNRWRLPPPEI